MSENKQTARRIAREITIQALYKMDILKLDDIEDILGLEWVDPTISQNISDFVNKLINGIYNNISIIDEKIKKFSKNWSFSRINYIDKAILRMSIYTYLYMNDIPEKVIINEAVEIAKKFGSEKSFQYINGILDGIIKNESRIN